MSGRWKRDRADAIMRARYDDASLVRRHRRGDDGARRELIERYLPLARRLAWRYRRAPEPMEDLVQVASLALVKAVDRWDPDRGLAFTTYAVPTIIGELRRHFRDSTWAVRPPRELLELSLAVEHARESLYAAVGREPTTADIARHIDRTPAAVDEALQAAEARSARPLDVPLRGDEPGPPSPAELIGGEDVGYERAEARTTIESLTRMVDRRAREVLRLRFHDDLLQSDIATRVGCSQMQVSRILSTALEALHHYAVENA